MTNRKEIGGMILFVAKSTEIKIIFIDRRIADVRCFRVVKKHANMHIECKKELEILVRNFEVESFYERTMLHENFSKFYRYCETRL